MRIAGDVDEQIEADTATDGGGVAEDGASEVAARVAALREGRPRPVALTRRARARRALHRAMTRRRGPLVVVHRWVSLVLVVWIVVESLTGALLVFEPQLTSWWNREDHQVTEGDVGMAEAVRAASTAAD